VGDAAGLGALPAELFFPLGWNAGSTQRIPGSRLTLADVIPDARMGQLDADLVKFWGKPGDEAGFGYLFVEIQKQRNGTIAVVGNPQEPRRLDQELGLQHPIVQYIDVHSGTDQAPGAFTEPTVPWPDLYRGFLAKAIEHDWNKLEHAWPPLERRRDVEAYLMQVNGAPIPFWASSLAYRMTQYACAVNNDEMFRQVLRDAHEVKLKEIQERIRNSKDKGTATPESDPSE
jgi:hypothetical protein